MTSAPAETTPAGDAPRDPSRDRPESHQFDFWIGDWIVSDPDGQLLGTNSVASGLAGCVLREAWTGVRGNRGTSVNFHDPASVQWDQVWTDDSGQVTHSAGELRDGGMCFRAQGFGDADGIHHQSTLDFIPNPDGSVRQWFQDSDDGKTWKTTFDGIYVRAVK